MSTDRHLRARTSRILMALPIAALTISLAACAGSAEPGGGPDGGSGADSTRPSTDELSAGITAILEDAGQSGILTEEQVDCISNEFLASEVSDEDLKNMAGGEDLQTSEEAKTLVTTTMQDAIETCAPAE